jgi:hypothetical protein
MGKTRSQGKSKPGTGKGLKAKKRSKTSAVWLAGKVADRPAIERKSGKEKRARKLPLRAVAPLDDSQIDQVAGIPDEAQMEEAIRSLLPADRQAFERLRELLAQHLGSHAAARLWLVSPAPGFETTPLDAIRRGHAKPMLEMLESEWGPTPTYA